MSQEELKTMRRRSKRLIKSCLTEYIESQNHNLQFNKSIWLDKLVTEGPNLLHNKEI